MARPCVSPELIGDSDDTHLPCIPEAGSTRMKDILIELWDIVLKTIWLGLAVAAIIGALRLMAWADTGSHGDGSQIEQNIIP